MQILTYEITDLKMEDKIEITDKEKDETVPGETVEIFSESAEMEKTVFETKETQKACPVQLQKEVDVLKDDLDHANKTIHRLQAELRLQQGRSNHVVATLKLKLERNQEAMKSEKVKSDGQLGEVLAHLLFLEGQLTKEQKHIKAVISSKDQLIQKQKKEIEDLTSTNQRLIEAVREHYARKGKNGLSIEHTENINGNSEVPPSPKIKDKHKTPYRSAFGSMKDKFWKHHRSSLDLSDSSENFQGNLSKGRQYSSQENLFTSARKNREARDKKCKSIAGYPDHSLEHFIPEEGEVRNDQGDYLNQMIGRNGVKTKHYPQDDVNVNGNHNSDSYHHHHHLTLSPSSPLMSATSMPTLTKQNSDASVLSKERPHSISSIESLSHTNDGESPNSKNAVVTNTTNNTSQSESNPFKNLKTILKRKGSKMKNKKRSVSMSQHVNQEEAMKKHFEKYEMS